MIRLCHRVMRAGFEVPCDSPGPLTIAKVGEELQLVHRRSGLALHHPLSRSFLPSYHYRCPVDDECFHFMQRVRTRIAGRATWSDEVPTPTTIGNLSWSQAVANLLIDMRAAGRTEGSNDIMDWIDRRSAKDLRSKIWRSAKLCGCSTSDALVEEQVRREFWWQIGAWWNATPEELDARQRRITAESDACSAADMRSIPQDPREVAK